MISMPRGPKITITCEVGKNHAQFLRRRLGAAWARLKRAPAKISVAVVSVPTMTRLHRQFLGKRTGTDVLAFETSHDAFNRVAEGEIVICLDMARRQARQRGHPVENELLLYALHGLLHLCGYVDATPAQAARMHAAEDQILKSIGVGPVFAPPTRRRRTLRPANAVAVRRASS